jgi:hypothetical protein
MNEKPKTSFILSGGGTRLMIYLGMYAALEELGENPDFLIATCGGAFAATVINAFESNTERKEFICSEDYFQFISNLQLTNQRKLNKIGLLTLRKILSKQNAPFIEDVFNKYLVETPEDLSATFPGLKNVNFSSKKPTIIIGSKILFNSNEVGQKTNNRKLYKKVIFTDTETAKQIDLQNSKITSNNYKNSVIDEEIDVETDFSMLLSARISMSDMFYLKPVNFNNDFFAGGAIDLIPIEIAKRISERVIIENKQQYSKVEEALVRAVMGYSGNKRLQEIESQNPTIKIDTSDIKNELKGHYVSKNINWKKMEVNFTFPKSHQHFVNDMEKQWNYGYKKVIEAFKNH